MHTIFFAKNKNKKTSEDDKQGFSFGLKCDRSPLQVKDLIQFDNNLVKIEKEWKFRKVNNDFQKNAMWRCEKRADIKEDTSLLFFNKQPVYKQLTLEIVFITQQYKVPDIPNMFSEFSAIFY